MLAADGEVKLGDFGLVSQVLAQEPEPLDRVRPDAPAELTAVVSRLMAKNPGGRYTSATRLVADLQQIRVDDVSG